MYTIHQEQIIDTTLQEAWDFISNPYNLNAITPDDMGFEILHDIPREMYNGLLVEYRIHLPVFGKQTWVTELKHIRPEKSFVDEQRLGPYRFWYHYHEISSVNDGVKFADRVAYQMPFGPLGKIVHAMIVQRQLQHIFAFRKEALVTAFSSKKTK